MSVSIIWVTTSGKLTKEQTRIIPIFKELYINLLKEMHIRRDIPLLLVDEKSWVNKKGLNLNPKSVAHYNEGIRLNKKSPIEAILIRESVLYWDDAMKVIPQLIRHELVHAKVKDSEKRNSHGEPFINVAKKYKNVAMIGDY
jgi:hypothetical protein